MRKSSRMAPKEKQTIEIEKTDRDPLLSFNQAVTVDCSDFLGTALMPYKSAWLGTCAAKGKTANNITNTANALACFPTIVLRPCCLIRPSIVRKMLQGITRLTWDAPAPDFVSFSPAVTHSHQ